MYALKWNASRDQIWGMLTQALNMVKASGSYIVNLDGQFLIEDGLYSSHVMLNSNPEAKCKTAEQ